MKFKKRLRDLWGNKMYRFLCAEEVRFLVGKKYQEDLGNERV